MKKRTIISLIITILCVIATNKLWLIFSPIPVKLRIAGEGNVKITAYLDKKDGEFKHSKKAVKNVELNTIQQTVKLDVNRIKSPKAFKIRILGIRGGKTLILSQIQLNKKRLSLKGENFSVVDGKLTVKDGFFYVTPNRDKTEIIYNEPLNTRCAIKFEFLTFISIIILSFLLFYKLTSYLADFKNIQNQSRIEIIFLAVFFVFLFVPMSYINNDEKSVSENRTLAKWYPFITETGKINYSFGKNFDEWFNDRFYLRSFFINLSSICTSKLNLSKVIIGQDGWLFLRWEDVFESYANLNLFTETELKEIVNNLENINNYCEKNNKIFVLFIAPEKYRIYGEYYPRYIKKNSQNKTSRANQLVNYIQQNSNIKVVYPYNKLIANKNGELLYYKTDSHWNSNGAYIGYTSFTSILKSHFNDFIKEV